MRGLPIRACLAALALVAAPGMALACAPQAPSLDAGFYRDDVKRLPRNARGVMFLPPSIKSNGVVQVFAKVADFRLTSPDDPRPLALRLHRASDGGAIRLEPIGGFAPNARYTFEYLPAHAKWRYRDRMSVTIDDAVVGTAGAYAIEPAPQPEVRMLMVPGSPACIHPVVLVTQPFSYRVPAALAPYRTALAYGTAVHSEPPQATNKALPEPPKRSAQLQSYHADVMAHERGMIDRHYTGADDLVVASCGQQDARGELIGSVAFPEVDDETYRVAPVAIDLGRNVLGECRPMEALARTMQAVGAERALETVCRRWGRYDAGSRTADPTSRWERALGTPHGLSACKFAALAEAVHSGQYAPDETAMGRLGATLAQSLQRARTEWLSNRWPNDKQNRKPISAAPTFQQSLDGLDYLMQRLPASLQPNASALLLPLLPELAEQLAEPAPYRPETLAALIIRAGSLPADVRTRITSIARSRTVSAPYARAILAALPALP